MWQVASAYYPPVPMASFGLFAVLLTVLGLAATFYYAVGLTTKQNRSLVQEVVVGLVASGLLGFGGVFLFLWAGIYV